MGTNAQQVLLGPGNSTPPKQGPGGGRGSKSPAPTMLLGLLMTMCWIILTFVDLEATEALFTQQKVTSFTPEWSLVLQLPKILVGYNMPIVEAKAAIVGWVLLVCTLTCVIGYDLSRDAVRHANHRLEKVFGAGVVILAGLDFVSNLMYGPGGSTLVGQIIFAVVVTFAGFFFGIPGFRLLEHGIKTWKTGY
jgi:hypothetical protein